MRLSLCPACRTRFTEELRSLLRAGLASQTNFLPVLQELYEAGRALNDEVSDLVQRIVDEEARRLERGA